MHRRRADDLVAALALCAKGPVVCAPAMHPRMWNHPATQKNVAELARQGRVTLVGPVEGPVASGDVGMGRMAEPGTVFDAIVRVAAGGGRADLAGKRVLVTAGPTAEDLDPVRFVTNRSSGKMGFAIAERAIRRGAEVTLVAGPVSLPTPPGARRVDVRSALAMQRAIADAAGPALDGIDALVMTAAVADYRAAAPSATKLKKEGEGLTIELVRNPDLLAEMGAARAARTAKNARPARPVLVGFALETQDDAGLVAYARKKLEAKQCDLVVANAAGEALGTDDNRAILVTKTAADPLPTMPKAALADAILDRVAALLG
jgi:phosphopantothenoylcysteine decarboxylase/phosphopantothenate--cysteine ligase